MLHVLQNIRSGELSVDETPAPGLRPGHVLIANLASVISAGIENMVMDLASKSLLGKARERPDHVRRVWQMLRSYGFRWTVPCSLCVRAVKKPQCRMDRTCMFFCRTTPS